MNSPLTNEDFSRCAVKNMKIDPTCFNGLSVKDPEPFYHTLTNFKNYQKQQEERFNNPSNLKDEIERGQDNFYERSDIFKTRKSAVQLPL